MYTILMSVRMSRPNLIFAADCLPVLGQVAVRKIPPGAMIDTVDDDSFLRAIDAKYDAMREIDEMADLEGEFVLLRD